MSKRSERHAEGTASLASAFAQAFGAASMGYCAGLP